MIRIKSVHVGERLLPLSFNLAPGTITHVIGPNGSGKSTLLSSLSGVGAEYKGQIMLGEADLSQMSLPDLALYRAYLSQSARPAFNLEVFQYLSLSIPSSAKNNEPLIQQALNEIADMLDISDKLHRSIQALSGGEWQRVRLAAMCLQIWPSLNPYAKLLILDEPAAPLDIAQEALLYKLIDRVAELGITVIMANHDLNKTLRHADQVLLLDKGILQN
ncbi:vitamin B12 ABC transporter ATP-binding protein BtuD, partial [Vibrio makurazakiensis]|uniref:vitamin B12 ABC transporter ATP-binding protein BtuD n=1 Tax=Vibrio makurazakiensis TaxID=2910250 RepID=UPI003D0F5558